MPVAGTIRGDHKRAELRRLATIERQIPAAAASINVDGSGTAAVPLTPEFESELELSPIVAGSTAGLEPLIPS